MSGFGEAVLYVIHSPGFLRVLGLMISSGMIVGAIIDGGAHEARRRMLGIVAALGVFFWFEEWAQQLVRVHMGTSPDAVDIGAYALAAVLAFIFLVSIAIGMLIVIRLTRAERSARIALDALLDRELTSMRASSHTSEGGVKP